ncbi:unnamed protein product [Blepharisma stoltei]|uniref:Uncharacterized protein n=1 Tax=Blepharisma stoltei TaxID=1481888 RepID=A0AAU9K9L8_9CILI|nr:unnamed protein product [Blepharisma stoltei]
MSFCFICCMQYCLGRVFSKGVYSSLIVISWRGRNQWFLIGLSQPCLGSRMLHKELYTYLWQVFHPQINEKIL